MNTVYLRSITQKIQMQTILGSIDEHPIMYDPNTRILECKGIRVKRDVLLRAVKSNNFREEIEASSPLETQKNNFSYTIGCFQMSKPDGDALLKTLQLYG
jgi:hypothetical protein